MAMIAPVLTSSPSSDAQERRAKLRISNAGFTITALPLLAAKEWGVFTANGLDMELILMQSSIVPAALSQGDIDYQAGVGPASVNATLRGFYFTSGTQQGSPIDQLIGSLARSFGTEEVAASSYSGQGKSYFLTDLIQKVIIGEAAWVSTDRAAVRRAMIIKAAAFAVIALFSVGLSVAWWVSYKHNSTLIDQTV